MTTYGKRVRCCRNIRNPTITKDTKDYMYLQQRVLYGAMTVCCCTHILSPTITKDTPKTSCTAYVAVELYLIPQYAKTPSTQFANDNRTESAYVGVQLQ